MGYCSEDQPSKMKDDPGTEMVGQVFKGIFCRPVIAFSKKSRFLK